MSRFRLYPTPAQEAALLEQCEHARYLWNLALEQWSSRAKAAIAKLQARAGDRRKDWVEKTSTGILANGWGLLVQRLEHKAKGRVERMNPAYTSQTCSVCGHCAPDNRESQAVFRCVACGHRANADVNAASNIAAGRAVSARRETPPRASPKREPQLATST